MHKNSSKVRYITALANYILCACSENDVILRTCLLIELINVSEQVPLVTVKGTTMNTLLSCAKLHITAVIYLML